MATQPLPATIRTDPMARGGRFEVANYTYPLNLFSTGASAFGKCWSMININVLSSSAALRKEGHRGQTVELNAADRLRQRGALAQERPPVSAAGGVGTGMVGSALAAFLAGGKKVVSAVAGAAGGAVAMAPAISAGMLNRETKRLKVALQLPMPNNLVFNYGAEWGEDNTALFDLLMRTASTVTNLSAQGSSVAAQAADAIVARSLAMNTYMGNGGISAATGLAANPKKEMVFNGVGFRQFTIDYRFYPKSQQEYDNIANIIHLLKYHMHPEFRTTGQFTFVYPSEFEVFFFVEDGAENPHIGKMATCVLENLIVNYTPEGLWVNHPMGVPNAVTVSMVFKELSILNKEVIDRTGF